VRATERREHVGCHRLHAQAEPIDAGPAIGRELVRVDAVGIAFDGDFGVIGPVDRVEDAHEPLGLEERRRAAAEEHARRRRVPVGAPALDVDNTRVDIGVDEMPTVGPRRKVAVITPRRAKRNVDIHTERHGIRLRPPARWEIGRTSRRHRRARR
jgi:hypothetical protein